MAASYTDSLSVPYTVFSFSRPLIKGKQHVRPCFMSLVELVSSKGMKRKRGLSEVAACINAEGVNIYDVAASQIISSYAAPPSTKFSCPPASIRCLSTRRTYASISYPRKQILCWEETKSSSGSSAKLMNKELRSYSRNSDGKADVVLLKVIHKVNQSTEINKDVSADILVVHADGELKCYSSDLVAERWSLKSIVDSKAATAIVYAATCTISTAKKSILKSRPEVAMGHANSKDQILLTISASPLEKHCGINLYLIPTSNGKRPNHMFSLSIPLDQPSEFPPAFSIHFPTGILHCIANGKLRSYSLSTFTPSIIKTLPLLSSGLKATAHHAWETSYSPYSVLNISSTMLLISTPDDLSLFETKYSSLHGRISFARLATSSASIAEDSLAIAKIEGESLDLSVYIQDLGLALGYGLDGIVGIQLPQTERKSARLKGGLLIDSICRGVDDLSLNNHKEDYNEIFDQLYSKTSRDTEEKRYNAEFISTKILPTITAEKSVVRQAIFALREYRNAGDIAQFEKRFADYVGVERYKYSYLDEEKPLGTNVTSKKKMKKDAENKIQMSSGAVDGHAEADKQIVKQLDESALELPEFITPQSEAWQVISESRRKNFKWKTISQEFVTAVLGMIFELKQESGKLKLAFFPPNVIKYLVESGNFSSTLISVACQRQRQQWEDHTVSNMQLTIGRGQFVDSLVDYDRSLGHLAWFLRETGELGIGETIRAIRMVLERLNSENRSFNLLPAPENDDEEGMLQRATREAEEALERASKTLEETAILEEVLRLAMRRLNSFPPGVVVRELRSGLEREQLIGLIRILRKELVVDREGSDEFEGEGALEAADVELVCDLLTCALDAIGLAGLILSNDTVMGQRKPGFSINLEGELDELDFLDPEDNGELLIDSLHEEVSKAVNALQDAAALSGLLRELCRHAGGMKLILESSTPQTTKTKRSKSKKSSTELTATTSTLVSETSSTKTTSLQIGKTRKPGKYLFHYKDKSKSIGKPVPINTPSSVSERQQLAVLPLTLPPKGPLAKGEMKVQLGGELVRRNAREIKSRESRKIGEYRVEKIVI